MHIRNLNLPVNYLKCKKLIYFCVRDIVKRPDELLVARLLVEYDLRNILHNLFKVISNNTTVISRYKTNRVEKFVQFIGLLGLLHSSILF